MNSNDLDNIPLLDDLISKGDENEQNNLEKSQELENDNILNPNGDLEKKIHDILQNHTSQATAEILAIIEASSEK